MTGPAELAAWLQEAVHGPVLWSGDGHCLLEADGLHRAAGSIAVALRRGGVGPGHVVASILPNGPAYAATMLGVWQAGAALVPVNPELTERERRQILAVSRAAAVVSADPVHLPAEIGVAGVAVTAPAGVEVQWRWDRPGGPVPKGGGELDAKTALVLFTSGSTSAPKGVVLSGHGVRTGVSAVVDAFGLSPADRGLGLLPWTHGHGLLGLLLSALRSGGSLVVASVTEATAPVDARRPAVTWVSATPPLLAVLADARPGPLGEDLRFIRSASAPLPTALAARLEERYECAVAEAYGMTETSHQAAANPPDRTRRRLGTVGLPTGTEIRVDGPEVAGGREIHVRGPALFSRYLSAPEATAAAMTADGWYRTQDLGLVHDDGHVQLLGRLGDVINRGGFKVSPLEVEGVLSSHPAVAACLVAGVPHRHLGEDVGAVVLLRPGVDVTVAVLRAHCRERLGPHKRPSWILLVETLPHLPNGKPSRRGARQLLAAAAG